LQGKELVLFFHTKNSKQAEPANSWQKRRFGL